MSASTSTNALNSPKPPLMATFRRLDRSTISRTVERIVAAILILALALALLGSFFAIGPGRSWVTPDGRSTLEALPGFSSLLEEKPGEGSLVAIDLTPASAPSHLIEVGVWELNIPIGQGFQIPRLNSFGSAPLAFYVTSGTVGAGSNGHENFVGAGDGMGLGEGWEYVRNVNLSPATIWVIAPIPWDVPEGFNYKFAPWIPSSGSGPTGTPGISNDVDAIQTRELMRVPVSIADGKDLTLTLGLYNVMAGTTFTERLSRGVRNIHVLDGQFDVNEPPTSGTAVPATTVRQGQNHAVTTESPEQTFKATGSQSLRILTVSVHPTIRIPIYTPSPQPKLPPVMEWTTDGGHTDLTLRLITMQPNASYQLTTSAGVIYQLIDGEVEAVPNNRIGSASLSPGKSVGQASGRGLILTNHSDKVAHVVQGIASKTILNTNEESASDYELKVEVEIQVIANANTSLANQHVSISLTTDTLALGEQWGTQQSPDVTLVTVAEGEVQATRANGSVRINPSKDADPVDAAAGEPFTIGVGGQVFGLPSSSFSVESRKEPTRIVRLTVSPKAKKSATPGSTPATPQINEATPVASGAKPERPAGMTH